VETVRGKYEGKGDERKLSKVKGRRRRSEEDLRT
jgi:hypothetical protein